MVARTRRSSAKALTHLVLNNFQKGISSLPDKVQMEMGYSPMARNVEWLQQGGFFVRKGVGPLVYGDVGQPMAVPGAIPLRFFHYVRDPAVATQFISQYMLSGEDGTIRVGVDYGTGPGGATPGTWVTLQSGGADLATDGPPTFTAWDTNVYISMGVSATSAIGKSMYRYDGAAITALGRAWTNDYAAPVGGNMPPARYAAAFAERMFVGCIINDSDQIEGSSIRWSHPGKPEDWAFSDEITVGQQGDIITALAPMRDMLVVFKRSSMHALLGSGSTNFRVVELSGTIGCTGEWTRDNQGRVVFWDGTVGACRFDGRTIDNIFLPLGRFMQAGAGGSITRCGGLVTDGEKIYVATDFTDFFSEPVPPDLAPLKAPRGFVPGLTTWQQLIDQGVTWGAMAGVRWMSTSAEFYNIVWVYREGAGWTSFSLSNPEAPAVTMLGQIRSRINPFGDVISNRRIVYGLSNPAEPLLLSDRFDDGTDRLHLPMAEPFTPINAYYMTPWLHGGLPAQNKRWKAPRVIQEADEEGVLLIDVYYDFNYALLRRTLASYVPAPIGPESYQVDKPGTIGRAKAITLRIRAEESRHWGVSSITIPIHPKVLR